MDIKNIIYEVRGKQVMLDSDLGILYECANGTKDINKSAKRNIQRFPSDFYFQLTEDEYKNLTVKNKCSRFQNGTLEGKDNLRNQAESLDIEDNLKFQIENARLKNKYSRFQIETLNINEYLNPHIENFNVTKRGQNLKYLPYVFTEQGIAMLSSVLRTERAAEVSVDIMRSFVKMRHIIMENYNMLERIIYIENNLEDVKTKILEHDEIFDSLNKKEEKEKIFFEGQIYEAYIWIIDLIKKAMNEIVIIDNYLDNTILDMLTKKKNKVKVVLVTRESLTDLDINKFNKQYNDLKVIYNNKFHDRFIIIDDNLYHLGASVKDLGKKCFGINKIEDSNYLKKIKNLIKEDL